MKARCDKLLSRFAFDVNLRRYSLGALAAIHPTSDFLIPLPPPPPLGREGGDNAAGGAQGGGTALSLLGELTLECLSAGALNVDAEGTVAEEVLRMLMEAGPVTIA